MSSQLYRLDRWGRPVFNPDRVQLVKVPLVDNHWRLFVDGEIAAVIRRRRVRNWRDQMCWRWFNHSNGIEHRSKNAAVLEVVQAVGGGR